MTPPLPWTFIQKASENGVEAGCTNHEVETPFLVASFDTVWCDLDHWCFVDVDKMNVWYVEEFIEASFGRARTL